MSQWHGSAAGTYGWFELAGLFASSLQKDASTIDNRSTVGLLHVPSTCLY